MKSLDERVTDLERTVQKLCGKTLDIDVNEIVNLLQEALAEECTRYHSRI